MGAELLVPLALVAGVFLVLVLAGRWALKETSGAARDRQKLEDLASIARREQGAQDALTAKKLTLSQLHARWRRLAGMRSGPDDGGAPGSNAGPQ